MAIPFDRSEKIMKVDGYLNNVLVKTHICILFIDDGTGKCINSRACYDEGTSVGAKLGKDVFDYCLIHSSGPLYLHRYLTHKRHQDGY